MQSVLFLYSCAIVLHLYAVHYTFLDISVTYSIFVEGMQFENDTLFVLISLPVTCSMSYSLYAIATDKWKFHFIQEEWRRGLKALRVDTIAKLKKALPELEKEVCLSLLTQPLCST